MKIEKFHEILFWPFFWEGEDNTFDQIVTSGHWQREDDLYTRSYKQNSHREQRTCYGEFVYFQPYVQRFFYGQGSQTPTEAWTRNDIEKVSVILSAIEGDTDTPARIHCSVEQLWLFRFQLSADYAIAILALEVKAQSALNLKDCQNFLDQFRRVYPPYWEGSGEAKRIPSTVEWHLSNGAKEAFELQSENDFFSQIKDTLRPPMAAHWAWLLTGSNDRSVLDQLRHVEDERMPSLTYLAVNDPRALTRGDYIRFCFADDHGSSASLPYAHEFLNGFEDDYCYDRYWSETSESGQEWMTSRFMNCGYAFTMVGSILNGFFTDEVSGALSHFRNHYFVMGLIAHFQKAALLLFSDKLSSAVSVDNDKHLAKEADKTLRQIIDFTDRYWFVDLSTQTQAQELYAQWRKHLKLDDLYQQVTEEARQLTDYLEHQAAKREATMVTRLTYIGAAWAVLSLIVSAGLIEILIDNGINQWWPVGITIALGIFVILYFIFSYFKRE